MKLEYILFFVENVSQVRDFYTGTLGLKIIEDAEDGKFALLSTGEGATLLGIHEGKPHASPPHTGIYFLVDDVDAMYEDLISRGVEFSYPPKNSLYALFARRILPSPSRTNTR